ncbi:ATP-grasp domain-containing protein [Paraburkholderia oxyphila]|uniref:ATP-grasp domain-containing protein n=1 Tax=Paraburkholderia oxyphila TaxID=614212 RepID=UPI0012ECD7C4|nr:tetratricopeptide repeat protein [Paraburkholderia oxyphila]
MSEARHACHRPEHQMPPHSGQRLQPATAAATTTGTLPPDAATEQSIEHLTRALDAAPLDVTLHARMLAAARAANDEPLSAAHELALAAFDLLGATTNDKLALVLYNVATVYAMKGRREAAIRWYRHALRIHPDLAIAHQNLAAALEREGLREEACAHREQAYRLQRVFTDAALGNEERRVLILGVGKGTGNVPVDALLSHLNTSRIRYAIDYADEAEDAQLPPYDLVFNGIGDPDVATPLAARLACFAARCDRPMLNPPEAIERTHRHKTAELLARVQDVIVPRCLRIDARPSDVKALTQQIEQSGLAFPLLMRPLATHGGEGLELHTSLASLWSALVDLEAPCYLTAWHDFRSADGYYRKYRIIYVNGEPYPYHLAISSHWMVHYFSAGMVEQPWKLDEERRFLADPFAALGKRANEAIVAIGRQLALDYGGIDFSLTADGQVLVFETNATMLAHREPRFGPLAHKNPYIDQIVAAFERMLQARTHSRRTQTG